MRVRVVERMRVIQRGKGVGLVGEEMSLTYGNEFVEVGSVMMNGRGLFVDGFYDCCTFDCDFTDDNGVRMMMMLFVMMIVILGTRKLEFT